MMLEVGDFVRDTRQRYEDDIGVIKKMVRTGVSEERYHVKWIKLCKESESQLHFNRVGVHLRSTLKKITIKEEDIPKLVLEVL